MFIFSIFNKFKTHKWKKLTKEQKKLTLQKVLNKLCKNTNQKPIKIKLSNQLENNIYGKYISAPKEEIIINEYLAQTNQFVALETLYHEFRHSYQKHIIETNTSFCNFKVKKWKRNYLGYISATKSDFEIYNIQPIEKDAKNFAYKKLKKHKFRFRKEPNYLTHLTTLKENINNSEKEAKQKYGIFYKIKLHMKIRKNQK